MKIAVCCSPGAPTLGPFGRGSDMFIWEVVDGSVVNRHTIRQEGSCCGGLARSVRGVDVVLCSGIGHGAMHHLVEQGTPVAQPKQESLNAEDVVQLWLTGASERFFVAADDCCHPAGSCGAGEHQEHEAHGH
jgi:predicted Fe-Mo cluster-binding NifX family protein